MTDSRFYIVKIMGDWPSLRRFRVIEKMNTIDGVRDRITNQSFLTLEATEEFIKEKEAGR